jgi:multidrug efflux system membrane fusion protein
MPNKIESVAPDTPRPQNRGASGSTGGAVQLGKRRKVTATWIVLMAIILIALGGFWAKEHRAARSTPGGPLPGRSGAGGMPVPVIAGVVEKQDVPIYLDGLGTVQAFNTVTVRTRVDGQVQRIAFVEGQDVRAGDLLAQIDPAPFQTALDQSVAKKAQDEAQLSIAKLTLARNAQLLTNNILAQQDFDTQKAIVEQFQALVAEDQAAINNARVQLDYATVRSPLDGRTGIRMVDQGNIVHAGDSNGIVVITQLRPITISFTLPEQNLRVIQSHHGFEQPLTLLAMDRDNRTLLSEGKLSVIDNQIDISTGTIRLKGTFPNQDLRLWPGQFVNVRVLVETRTNGLVVPASVVQRGPEGAFAFVIDSDLTAKVRPIKVAQIDQGQALIQDGLAAGENVVVDGQYKLQPGAKVKLSPAGQRPANGVLGSEGGSSNRPPDGVLKDGAS